MLFPALALLVATPLFTEITISAGWSPEVVAAADLNHDGRLDLVIANSEPGAITVLLNDGGGRFHAVPGSPFPAGHLPNDLAVGDFDHDGNLDIAIANHQSPFITLLLGDGKGGLRAAPHSPFRTESNPHPHGVAAADYNGDGNLDIMTDSWGIDKIELLLGNGKGGFTLGPMFDVGKRPYQRLRTADLNHDGHPDIVTTNLDADTVTVLLGDGRGGFHEAAGSPVKVSAAPWAVAIDDLNGDGNLDLATVPYDRDAKARGGPVAATVLLGDGKGGFRQMPGSPFSLGGCGQPQSPVSGDFNGDGVRDIVVSCTQSDQVAFLLGSKSGGYGLLMRRAKARPKGIAVADFNGDGKPDIAIANSGDGTITLLLGR